MYCNCPTLKEAWPNHMHGYYIAQCFLQPREQKHILSPPSSPPRITLDTPVNRKGMPNADFSQWTPLQYLADVIVGWGSGQDRPASSPALLEVKTVDGNTAITPL